MRGKGERIVGKKVGDLCRELTTDERKKSLTETKPGQPRGGSNDLKTFKRGLGAGSPSMYSDSRVDGAATGMGLWRAVHR